LINITENRIYKEIENFYNITNYGGNFCSGKYTLGYISKLINIENKNILVVGCGPT